MMKAALAGVMLVFLCTWGAMSQLRLKSINPDEPASYTYNERFSTQNALRTTKQLGQYLRSFRALTTLAKGKLTKSQIAKVGNTQSDTQDLGFANAVGTIEGTLRKQAYQISKLDYELARMQHAQGKIARKTLVAKETAYRNAEKGFQRFWDSFGIAD